MLVILIAAKDLDRRSPPHEILRCAQDDGCSVNGYIAIIAELFCESGVNLLNYPLRELANAVKHIASGEDAEFPTVGSVSSQARKLLTEE